MHGYDKEKFSALDAVSWAQVICFAPMMFKAAVALKKLGLLKALEEHASGLTAAQAAAHCHISAYAATVLLDMGLSARIVLKQDQCYRLAKTGAFLLNDPLTAANLDFTEHVCYEALNYLDQSLLQGRPCGLQVFGDWPSIYPALTSLPPAARDSWFKFDHFYSDSAFKPALRLLQQFSPALIFDVGGNTGRFAAACLQQLPACRVSILDLPEQIAAARGNKALDTDRISFQEIDVLSAAALPQGADIWWMSQFLDCFSTKQIEQILTKVHAAMSPAARLCILELFWDNQRFAGASFALNATSLYFTVLANGNSRFYSREEFVPLLTRSGFILEAEQANLGLGHTLLICRKDQS